MEIFWPVLGFTLFALFFILMAFFIGEIIYQYFDKQNRDDDNKEHDRSAW